MPTYEGDPSFWYAIIMGWGLDRTQYANGRHARKSFNCVRGPQNLHENCAVLKKTHDKRDTRSQNTDILTWGSEAI